MPINKRFPNWENANEIIEKIVNTSFKLSYAGSDKKMFGITSTFFITIECFKDICFEIPPEYMFVVLDYFADLSLRIYSSLSKYKDFYQEIQDVYTNGEPYDFTNVNKTYLKILELEKEEKGIDYKAIALKEMGVKDD